MKRFRISIFILLCCFCLSVIAQKKEDFSDEVAQISSRYDTVGPGHPKTVVFTGSSSIRLWNGLQESFPAYRIINTGFGGSESSDLLHFVEPLILKYQPEKVFIYEGDNDLSYRKSPARILRTTRKILNMIWERFPETEVVLIAAKPSPERWNLKRRFQRLNRKFARFAEKAPQVAFANVWDAMLKGDQLDYSLYEEDGLHMNEKGYALWYEVLRTYLN